MNLRGQHVLVTGGTGSFGHKMANEFAAANAGSVTIFSRDEKKQYEMRKKYPDFRYIIGDIRNLDSVSNAFKGISVVFHAAALKQVPSCEEFPAEAMKTNCVGAWNVCEAAKERNVRRVVCLSTDKAVMPINAMGITKALAEKIVVSQPNPDANGTIFCCVRYGNIMASRGSVLPLWRHQINTGATVTITDSSMTRFLMNLTDSVRLVDFALQNAVGGETYIYKAKSLNILNLAKAYLDFHNLDCKEGAMIGVGRRPGEKLHECLVHEDELYRTVDISSTFVEIKKVETSVTRRLSAPFCSDNASTPTKEELTSMFKEAEKDMEDIL